MRNIETDCEEKNRILSFVNTHKKIFIYGAGTYGKRYFDFLKDNGVEVSGFIVSYKEKNSYCGKPIYEKKEIENKSDYSIGIIPAFENVNVSEMREWFSIQIDIFEPNHILFLKYITGRRIEPIIESLVLEYGIAEKLLCKQEIKRILVVRTDAIGDLICTIPFIRELKKNYMDSQITVVVRESNRLILENCPYIDELLFYDSDLISGEIYEQCEKYEFVKRNVKKFAKANFKEKSFDAVFLPRELMAGRNIMDELLIALESGAKYRYTHIIHTDKMKPYVTEVFRDMFTYISVSDKPMHEIEYQLQLLMEIGYSIKNDNMHMR